MDKFFNGLPVELALWGNLLVCAIGAIFIWGAPVERFRKPLKWFFFIFWVTLAFYYMAKIPLSLQERRLNAFISPWPDPDSWILHKNTSLWMPLVILSDLSILMLILSQVFDRTVNRNSRWALSGIFITSFICLWIIDFKLQHNAISNLIAVATFLYLAWSCRIEHIASSLPWIIYALLHLPVGLRVSIPVEWRHTLFVTLLAAKLSLIMAMYAMLEVKKSTRQKPGIV